MADPKMEVRTSAGQMLKTVQALAEKQAGELVEGKDFNALLARAKKALPNSPAIAEMQPFGSAGTTLGNLAVRLAALLGALAGSK